MSSTTATAPGPRLRLAPGLRICARHDEVLQVGLDPGHRALLPDSAPTRALLERLGVGVDPAHLPPETRPAWRRLQQAGLLVPDGDDAHRSRARASARVRVDAADSDATAAARLLTEAGLTPARAGESEPVTVTLVVRTAAEPRRGDLDAWVRADHPHLLVTFVAGRARVGPLVVPGETACVRCLDEHLTDQDPRHPLIVEQHLDRDPHDRPSPAVRALLLAWAVRDLVVLVEGGRPATWSATVDLADAGPAVRHWSRHPRCGCAWSDLG